MPNIWWISHVRPIRAELTDPKEMESCSCRPHSSSPRSTVLLLLLLLPAVFSSVLSCQSNGPSRSGNIYFLFRCSSSDVGSYRVVFIRWEDNREKRKGGDTQEEGEKKKQKRGSEVGSRHHLLRMFVAVNLLRSSCRVHAAAEI